MLSPESCVMDWNWRFSDLSLPQGLPSHGEPGPSTLAHAEIYKLQARWEDADRVGKRLRRMENLSPTSWQGRLTRRTGSKCQVHQGRAEQESQHEAWPLRSAFWREHSKMWILETSPENGWERDGRTPYRASPRSWWVARRCWVLNRNKINFHHERKG